jgi:hypothetical protein
MEKNFEVRVFGKKGCDKCAILNQRLDKLLATDEWQDFEKSYSDVETSDGIISFCEAECINPQRIPAMIVLQRDEGGAFMPVPNAAPGEPDKVCKKAKLYQFLGLQTDYTDSGKGVITPKMIKSCLAEARAAC